MTANLIKLIALRKIAQDLCEGIGDTNYSKEIMYFRWAVNGYRDLLMDVIPNINRFNIKSEVYRIGDNLAVDLPDDFLYYTKIGICNAGRMIDLLGYDTSLCKDGIRDYCEDETPTEVPFFNVRWGGNYYGELYGRPGGYTNNGYYDYDKKTNRIYFRNIDTNADIIVEYQSTDDGSGVVPAETEQAIKAYIRLEKAMDQKGNYQQEYRSYQGERNRLKRYYNVKTAREVHDTLLRSVYSSVKR